MPLTQRIVIRWVLCGRHAAGYSIGLATEALAAIADLTGLIDQADTVGRRLA
jgi:hypothetical protein